jgi:hypothetical protein
MSMVKRATGKIEKFTDSEGHEVQADNLVWADEKKDDTPASIKDELVIPLSIDMDLDIDASDEDDTVIAKDC